jgi:hypothetical protein
MAGGVISHHDVRGTRQSAVADSTWSERRIAAASSEYCKHEPSTLASSSVASDDAATADDADSRTSLVRGLPVHAGTFCHTLPARRRPPPKPAARYINDLDRKRERYRTDGAAITARMTAGDARRGSHYLEWQMGANKRARTTTLVWWCRSERRDRRESQQVSDVHARSPATQRVRRRQPSRSHADGRRAAAVAVQSDPTGGWRVARACHRETLPRRHFSREDCEFSADTRDAVAQLFQASKRVRGAPVPPRP